MFYLQNIRYFPLSLALPLQGGGDLVVSIIFHFHPFQGEWALMRDYLKNILQY
jgi:hypothetical protein